MKVLAVLALAVFIGCQANLSNAEKPNPHLEHLITAFWNYIAKAVHPSDETSHVMRTSQLGQEVKLTQTPPSEDNMTKITKEADVLRERLEKDINIIRDKLEPYADNLKSQIQQRVEELRMAMTPYADSLDSETLKTTLLQKSEELRGNLEQSAKELQSQMEPYTAELKDNVGQYLYCQLNFNQVVFLFFFVIHFDLVGSLKANIEKHPLQTSLLATTVVYYKSANGEIEGIFL
uniref:Apolipoprotein A-IV n=1 Tax=Cyprinus carpio TaxID=7962 RepID=A0A8C1NLQ1_CYPCA